MNVRQSFAVVVIGLCGVAVAWAQGRGNSPRTGQQPTPTDQQQLPTRAVSPGAAQRRSTPAQAVTPQSSAANPETAPLPTSAAAQPPVFVRATQILGMEVRDSSGLARIGQIADLLLTPGVNASQNIFEPLNGSDTGGAPRPAGNAGIAKQEPTWWRTRECDLRFALIQIENSTVERVLVMPWELLQFQGTYFTLGLDPMRLRDAPSVMLNDPRILNSEKWLDQIGGFYANDLLRTQVRPDGLTPKAPAAQSPLPRRSTMPTQPPRRN